MSEYNTIIVLLIGVGGAIAGGSIVGWFTHKRKMATKKFSKKQKREMDV